MTFSPPFVCDICRKEAAALLPYGAVLICCRCALAFVVIVPKEAP